MTTPPFDPTGYGQQPGNGPLRYGGIPLNVPIRDNRMLPSARSHESEEQVASAELMRDLFEGPEEVRRAGARYLPQDPGEDPTNYQGRLKRSVFFNATRQTVDGIVGMIFRRDPVLGEDVPEEIQADWENIDGAGTHGAVFTRQVEQDAVMVGHAAILVEFPATGGTQTLADERQGVRPYWVPIEKEAILSWRTTIEGGRRVLTQLVLEECQWVADGAFGETEQTRYRVLRRDPTLPNPVTYQVLEVTDDQRVIEVASGFYSNQTEIPIAEVSTSGSEGLFESRPPLLDLAYLNIAHYQVLSDHLNSIHKTNVPIFTTIGATMPARGDSQPTQILGPNTGLALPAGGDAKYVSHDGQALGSSKAMLDDLKADMATMGLAMLAPSKRVAETADAKRIDKAATDSSIAVMARGLQDAIERCLQFHANYLRLPEGGSVTVNRDYDQLALSAQQVQALSALVANGQLSLETLWQTLAQGNVLPDDFDPDSEKAMLEADAAIKAANAPPPPQLMAPAPNAAPPAGPDTVEIQNPDGTPRMRMVRTRGAA